MDKNPASMIQCFSCEYWDGQRQYEPPGYISYEGQFASATCENPTSPRHRDQVQPIASCSQWVKWRKI